MEPSLPPAPVTSGPGKPTAIRVFGIGAGGLAVTERLMSGGWPAEAFVAVDIQPPATSSAAEKVQVEVRRGRAMEPGPAPVEASVTRLKSLCEGVEVVFIVAGLGGNAGTGLGPALARAAKEAGALVLGFATLPFDCEGSRRQSLAREGLEALKESADGVICLPNQKVAKALDERTSLLDAFKAADELLADAVVGLWRLVSRKGLIEIHFDDLRELLREQHAESAFAVAQAAGATRSREVLDKLLAHPMLDGGEVLSDSNAVLVSLMGGPDLTLTEVNRVMEEINGKCLQAQVLMGAVIDPAFAEQLAVTIIAARKEGELSERETPARGAAEDLATQLVDRCPAARPGSRFVPPPPVLPPEKMRQLLTEQTPGAPRPRKTRPRMRQGQLPLEIVSKGRFDKSEPTIHKGEDLDVPTYIRRGVALN